jgi:hypothetical protein
MTDQKWIWKDVKGRSIGLISGIILEFGWGKRGKYFNQDTKGESTPRKLVTATQPQFPRIVISLSWAHVTEWSSANWGNYVTVFLICAAPFSNMCSTRADNNSRKLRMRCRGRHSNRAAAEYKSDALSPEPTRSVLRICIRNGSEIFGSHGGNRKYYRLVCDPV